MLFKLFYLNYLFFSKNSLNEYGGIVKDLDVGNPLENIDLKLPLNVSKFNMFRVI